MATPATYAIILPDGRAHYSDVSVWEIERICDQLGYDRAHVLRKLRDKGRVVLKDDLGKFEIVRQAAPETAVVTLRR